jgi:hypothetical protein
MKTLLSIDSKYISGRWKGKTVKKIIDENFYAFRAHWKKYTATYSKDVKNYLQETKDALRRTRSAAFLLGRDYRKAIAMPNK